MVSLVYNVQQQERIQDSKKVADSSGRGGHDFAKISHADANILVWGVPPPITSTKEQYNALLRHITRRDHKNRLDLDQNGVKTGIKLLWVIS